MESARHFRYSVVRCVPVPRRGEFVNVGVVVEDLATGRLIARSVVSFERARRLGAGDQHVHAAERFFLTIADRQLEFAESGRSRSAGWPGILDRLAASYRNVIQLSPPQAIDASDAASALHHAFGSLVLEPNVRRQPRLTRRDLVRRIESAYAEAQINPSLLRNDMELYVGSNVHQPIDIALGNGRTLQIAQAWSFEVAGVRQVATAVKAWAYAIERLRGGEAAKLVSAASHASSIEPNIAVEAVVAPPPEDAPDETLDYFEESSAVLIDLGVRITRPSSFADLTARARLLVEGLQPIH